MRTSTPTSSYLDEEAPTEPIHESNQRPQVDFLGACQTVRPSKAIGRCGNALSCNFAPGLAFLPSTQYMYTLPPPHAVAVPNQLFLVSTVVVSHLLSLSLADSRIEFTFAKRHNQVDQPNITFPSLISRCQFEFAVSISKDRPITAFHREIPKCPLHFITFCVISLSFAGFSTHNFLSFSCPVSFCRSHSGRRRRTVTNGGKLSLVAPIFLSPRFLSWW